MSTSAPPPPARREIALDPEGLLAEDLPCRGCGYNLRGLSPRADCPECSISIEYSMHGDLLRFCEPEWVERLARGVKWIIIFCFAGLGFWFVYMAVIAIAAIAQNISMVTISMGSGAVNAVLSVLLVFGIWLVTTPDRGETDSEPPISARRLARWCAVALPPAAFLQMAGNQTTGTGSGPLSATSSTPVLMVLLGLGMVASVFVLIGSVAGLVWFRRLAVRIPDDSIARQTGWIVWGYGGAQGLGLVVGVAMIVAMSSAAASGGTQGAAALPSFGLALIIVMGGGCLTALMTIVFGVWFFVLLFLYRKAFRIAAGQAREFWGEPGSRRLAHALTPLPLTPRASPGGQG